MEKAKGVLQFIRGFLLPNEKRKKPMLDALPVWSPIASSVFFIIVFLIFLLINGIWQIDTLVREETKHVYTGNSASDFLTKTQVLNEARGGVMEDHFVRTNDFLKIFLYLRKKTSSQHVGIQEEDLKFSYTLDLYRKQTLGKPYDTITHDVTATLSCPISDSTKDEDLECDGIELYFSETVPVYRYVLNIKLNSDLDSYKLLNDTVSIGWRCDGSVWLILQIIFTWFVWVFVLAAFIGWMLVSCSLNGFNNWSLEQRMVQILFVLGILYVDPFYLLDDCYDASWVTYVFKFGDAAVMCTFVTWLWFCMHMFTHWIGQPKAKKNIVIWVYSIVLGILFWVFLFVIMLAWRYTRDFSVFFQSIGYAMIITNCFLFPFHLIRLVVLLTKQQIEETFETIKRMIFLFGITLPTVFGVFLMMVVKPWGDQLNAWFYEGVMLLITCLLAIQFLPSWKQVDPPSAYQSSSSGTPSRYLSGGYGGMEDEESRGIVASTPKDKDFAVQEPLVEVETGTVEQEL